MAHPSVVISQSNSDLDCRLLRAVRLCYFSGKRTAAAASSVLQFLCDCACCVSLREAMMATRCCAPLTPTNRENAHTAPTQKDQSSSATRPRLHTSSLSLDAPFFFHNKEKKMQEIIIKWLERRKKGKILAESKKILWRKCRGSATAKPWLARRRGSYLVTPLGPPFSEKEGKKKERNISQNTYTTVYSVFSD